MHKFLKWLAGAVGAILMFATSISPEEAGSKLAAWAKLFGWENPPQSLVLSSVDTWGFWVGFILLCVAVVWFIWPTLDTVVDKNAEHSVRGKYSSEQTLEFEFSGQDGVVSHKNTLNLDNTATLTMGSEKSLDGIDMLLLQTSPLVVDRPKGDQYYNMGGGISAQFPSADQPGMEIQSARMINATGAQEFKFTRDGPGRTQRVSVGRRTFRITLDQVRERTRLKHIHLQWTFIISEE